MRIQTVNGGRLSMPPSCDKGNGEWRVPGNYTQGPKLHSLLDFNPEIEDDRRKFDGQAVIEEVKRKPEAARARYNFKGCYSHCYPLHMAVMLGASRKVVDTLLEAYPDAIQGKDRQQSTALHSACEFGSSLEVTSLLLEKFRGAVKERDYSNNTPLNSACKNQPTPEVISLLMKTYPEAMKIKNNEGMTPLHSACAYNAPIEVVSLLLESWPAAAREKDSNGLTPLHVSCEYQASIEVISFLMDEYPAAAKEKDNYGRTPLQSACFNDAPFEVLKLLLEEHPSAVKENDIFMGSLQDYDFENEEAAKLVLSVFRLYSEGVDNEIAGEIMKYFIDIGWWGGAKLVVDIFPSVLNASDDSDKLLPCVPSKSKLQCKLLTHFNG